MYRWRSSLVENGRHGHDATAACSFFGRKPPFFQETCNRTLAGIMAANESGVLCRIWTILLLTAALFQAKAAPAPLAEFPLAYREELLWVEVKVPQSNKPLNFLLDTGASVSVVNLSTARRLELNLGSQVNVAGVGKTLVGHWPVRLSAKAGDLELPGKYLALDLSKLSAACNNSVDGLIGADFFCDRVVQIDYKAQKLRVLPATSGNERSDAVILETRRCGMCVTASVNGGKSQRLRVDTGCATALQWVTRAVPNGCTSKMAIGLTELNIPQTHSTVSIAGQTISNVPTGLHQEPIFDGESGLVGNELLARFGVLTLDAKNGRLILGQYPRQ
jgi:hypothetical protein